MKVSLGVCTVLALSIAATAVVSAQKITRRVFVTAEQNGAPVLDLTAADFQVKEGGETRVVTSAGLANGPMRIILMIDTGQAAEPWQSGLKAGLAAFIDAIPPQHEIGIVSIGRQFRVRIAPSTDRAKVKDSANKLGSDGGGNVLLDGMMETETRFQKKEGVQWPVYVIVTTDMQMTTATPQNELNAMLKDLSLRATTIHAVALQTTGPSSATEMAQQLAKVGGGSYSPLLTKSAVADKLKAIGEQIAADNAKAGNKYRVDFVSDAKSTAGVNVAILRGGIQPAVSFQR